jgi:uncharacterized membrane protein YdfJ with MMPL/SSD domain
VVNTIYPKAKHGDSMKILTFLINHKWLVVIISVLILTITILVIIKKRPPEQGLQQTRLTEEQQAKQETFKSGKYQLSKPRTW